MHPSTSVISDVARLQRGHQDPGTGNIYLGDHLAEGANRVHGLVSPRLLRAIVQGGHHPREHASACADPRKLVTVVFAPLPDNRPYSPPGKAGSWPLAARQLHALLSVHLLRSLETPPIKDQSLFAPMPHLANSYKGSQPSAKFPQGKDATPARIRSTR